MCGGKKGLFLGKKLFEVADRGWIKADLGEELSGSG